MEKRERLERAIAGEAVDRVPVALWRHWPGDDQRAADLAFATVAFQQTYDWDFVKVTPASTGAVFDYGIKDACPESIHGDRVCVKPVVTRSLEWTELRTPDVMRGELGKQLEALRLITADLGGSVPVVATIISPLTQARQIAGGSLFIRHLRTNPDRLRTGLNILTETILRFIDAMKHIDVAGIYYVTEHATHEQLSEDEYAVFGAPYDRKILETLPPRFWLNLIQLKGESPMMNHASTYPAQVVNWDTVASPVDLTAGKALVTGAVCGGLGPLDHLNNGTPMIIREAAREAITQTSGRRFILGASGAIPVTTPLSNLRAVRQIVQEMEVS